MATTPTRTINVLQAGRALAALAVVAHHAFIATAAFSGPVPTALDPIFLRGYLGVDFFFVLSGFIIYHSTAGKNKSLRSYSLSRIRRIYVPYLPIGIAMAILYSLTFTTRDWGWLASLTLLPIHPGPALSVAWTLQHEILFYLLFALLYYSGTLLIGSIVWIVAIVGLGIGAAGKTTAIPFMAINLEFLFGMAACILLSRSWYRPFILWLSPLPLLLWLALGAQREQSVMVGLSLAMIVPALVNLEWKGRIRVAPSLLFLGDASYSIYLLHDPAISVSGRAFGFLSWPVALIANAAAGTLGGVIYYCAYERPALRLISRRKRSGPPSPSAPQPAVPSHQR